MTEHTAPLYRVCNVCKTYGTDTTRTHVLTDFNLTVAAGTRIALIGASGSGKSTLLHLMAGLDTPDSGTIAMQDTDITALSDTERTVLRRTRLGFIYQFHHLLAEYNALDNTALPLRIRGSTKQTAYKAAKELLTAVGLAHRIHYYPNQLSGGERQRVAVARAMITRPAAVLADEPTGNLDKKNADTVIHLLTELQAEFSTTLLIATHDESRMQSFDDCIAITK